MAQLHPFSFMTNVTVWAESQEQAEELLPGILAEYDDFDWTYDDWTSNDPEWVEAMGGVVEI